MYIQRNGKQTGKAHGTQNKWKQRERRWVDKEMAESQKRSLVIKKKGSWNL